MVWRQQNGERGGQYGGWVSKPGFDVTTCSPGEFLLDTNAQVFQCVLTGTTNLLYVPPGSPGATIGAGTYNTAVPLPSAFGPYSNLVTSVVLFMDDEFSGVVTGEKVGDVFLKHNTVSGVLNLSIVLPTPQSVGFGRYRNFFAIWSVFRGQF